MFRKLGDKLSALGGRMADGMRRFMYGRCGVDDLGRVLFIGGLVLLIAGMFFRPLTILAYAVIIWYFFRVFSKNLTARHRENAAYLRNLSAMRDHSNRYFRCPRCKQTVRVPKGKGKISIRCPKCGEQFVKTT